MLSNTLEPEASGIDAFDVRLPSDKFCVVSYHWHVSVGAVCRRRRVKSWTIWAVNRQTNMLLGPQWVRCWCHSKQSTRPPLVVNPVSTRTELGHYHLRSNAVNPILTLRLTMEEFLRRWKLSTPYRGPRPAPATDQGEAKHTAGEATRHNPNIETRSS